MPHALDSGGLAERRRERGLEPTAPLLRELLGAQAHDAYHLLIATDPAGHLLWVKAIARPTALAERIELAPDAL